MAVPASIYTVNSSLDEYQITVSQLIRLWTFEGTFGDRETPCKAFVLYGQHISNTTTNIP